MGRAKARKNQKKRRPKLKTNVSDVKAFQKHIIKQSETKVPLLKKSGWNSSLSLEQNYFNLGLAADVNASLRDKTKQKYLKKIDTHHSGSVNVGKFWKDNIDTKRNMTSENLTKERRIAKGRYLSEDEIAYIAPIVSKYGSTYVDKMFWDIKLNYYQKTKSWLKDKLLKYKLQQQQTESEKDSLPNSL